MFGPRRNPQSQIAQDLSEDLKRKISEIHLKIQSGDLTTEQLAEAYQELNKVKGLLETKVLRACSAAPKPAHP